MDDTTNSNALIPVVVEDLILIIRDQKVILDADLAKLYGVSTKALNQAIKRNRQRFPQDFMFTLSQTEMDELVTKCDRFKNLKHSTALSCALTEHGAIMAATVLKSPRAMAVSIYVVRAFVHLRSRAASHMEVIQKLDEIESRLETHDRAITSLFEAIRELMAPPPMKPRRIGFIQRDE